MASVGKNADNARDRQHRTTQGAKPRHDGEPSHKYFFAQLFIRKAKQILFGVRRHFHVRVAADASPDGFLLCGTSLRLVF